jgi:glycosyltransferase involved in cell wall biosynthesis
MFHQFRQVYDLWGQEYGFQPGPTGESVRKIIMAADNEDIPRSRHIYTNSREVANRLKTFNGIDAKVLMPPLKNPDLYYTDRPKEYIFYPSRINGLKRQHLAIEAMKYVKSGVRLIVAGVSPDERYFDQLKNIIQEHGLEDRVELHNRWISDEEKRKWFAEALGAIYIPYQEDSCGFVSMEAFYSAKPVISCHDSGGTKEIVEDAVNGYMVDPTPQAIAQAMDRLYEDKALAERMGQSGMELIHRLDITWPSTIERLLR